jgi:dipeptidyl aminopeptidase/acylaminoacyl peptidase
MDAAPATATATPTPFGRWPSPLSAALAAAGKVSLSEVCSDGDAVYWLESRPDDGGRTVFVRADSEGVVDISPAAVSIRSRVHEYGGGACCLVPHHGPSAFAYVDLTDQRVWLSAPREPGARPHALTDEPPPGERWVHGGIGASADGDWVVAVREVHVAGRPHPHRCIVALGTRPDNAGAAVLAEGHDFYGAPRLCPRAERLAVVVWDHPDMQWDRSTLTVTALEVVQSPGDGDTPTRLTSAGEPWVVEAGPEVSVGQPAWQPDGTLRFISDREGWWQPYVHSGRPDGGMAAALTTAMAEFHGPDWVLGQHTMARLADGTVVARMSSDGLQVLVLLEDPARAPRPVAQPCVDIAAVCAHGEGGVVYIGTPPDGPPSVWLLDPGHPDGPTDLRPRPPLALSVRDISVGQPFSLQGPTGRTVHGLVYPPTLEGTIGPPGARPPLVVGCHGGPTGAVGAGFDIVVQYFTSRGFAYAAVDYAGSTGYGRAFRCSLWGLWGVADAEDCLDAARHLAALGHADASRLAIRGSSSGGLTALNALAAGPGMAAAVSWYGVSDLLALVATTHDFEAHYTDRLIGPLPEARALYEARSPTRRAGEINGSVLLLQGLDDPIVPPAQTESLRDALLAEGRQCEAQFFAGESHGFRRAETLVAALEAELAFYQRELGL